MGERFRSSSFTRSGLLGGTGAAASDWLIKSASGSNWPSSVFTSSSDWLMGEEEVVVLLSAWWIDASKAWGWSRKGGALQSRVGDSMGEGDREHGDGGVGASIHLDKSSSSSSSSSKKRYFFKNTVGQR